MSSPAAIAFTLMQGISAGVGSFAASTAKPVLPNPTQYNDARQMQAQSVSAEVASEQEQANLSVTEGQSELARQGYEGNFMVDTIAQQYNSNGVLQQGSPMAVINQARTAKQNEIQAYGNQVAATSDLLNMKAFITGSQGRSQQASDEASFNSQTAAAKIGGIAQSGRLQTSGITDISSALSRVLGTGGRNNTFGNNPSTSTYAPTGGVGSSGAQYP